MPENKDVEEYLSLVSGFVSLINSWSVCDTFDFAGKQRFVDRNKERVWQFLEGWMQSDKEYEIRFGVVMGDGALHLMRTIYRTYCNG